MTNLSASRRVVALIDIGNTRIKLGWLDRTSGEREQTALALGHQDTDCLKTWFTKQNVIPDAAIGVNVAGPAKARAAEELFLSCFDISVHWLSSQPSAAGVLNRYANPAQLGADRWVAMIGLSQTDPHATTPLLLASFGTATTLDTLCPVSLNAPDAVPGRPAVGDERPPAIRWTYDGGLIFPGPALMRSSLASNTAQLPDARGMPAPFPTDTHQAIVSGIAAAQAGALIRQWHAGWVRYGVPPRVYGTGGGWATVHHEAQALLAAMQCRNGIAAQSIQYLASPILDGLAHIAQTRDQADTA